MLLIIWLLRGVGGGNCAEFGVGGWGGSLFRRGKGDFGWSSPCEDYAPTGRNYLQTTAD